MDADPSRATGMGMNVMPLKNLFETVVVGTLVAMTLAGAFLLRCDAQTAATASTASNDRAESPFAIKFRQCDSNGDSYLSEAEYLTLGQQDPRAARRDFTVFDFDRDGRMNLVEFLAVPNGKPEEQRGAIPDPVILLVERSIKTITRDWRQFDQNVDELLDPSEFKSSGIPKQVRGLESSTFDDWDLNGDGKLSRDEAKRLLEAAYGVRTLDGVLHRSKAGRVNDGRLFRSLKIDPDGFVTRDDYFRALGPMEHSQKEAWFALVDQNRDGRFNYAEFSTSPHRTDPVETFLQLDVDFDGRLSSDELDALPPDRFPVGCFLFPAFDDDKDGALCLEEFLLTPVINLLAAWESAQDANGDGQLSIDEFRFSPLVELSALSAEYFRRLDVDEDQMLSIDEFAFVTNRPQSTEIFAIYSDKAKKTIAIPGYPIICSPEISPDNKWVAVDGWKQGQSNVDAHILFASLESDEFRDLGIGCMPSWSVDGRRIVYCKYSRGVFIRDVDSKETEETCIDPRGWSIQFAPDGLKTAYLLGSNIVIHDVKTGEKRQIFPRQNLPFVRIEHNLTWSADSRRICVRGYRANGAIEIAIVSATGEDPNLKIRCDGKYSLPDFAWHPDGKHLMFPMNLPGRIGQIYQVDPDGDEQPVPYQGQPKHRNNGGLCWSRDGKIFVFVSTR